jgi:hypothetical protein
MANPVLCNKNRILTESLFLYSLRSNEGKLVKFVEESHIKKPVVAQLLRMSIIVLNPKIHCRVHKSPPLDRILSQTNPFNTLTSHLLKFHFNIILPSATW